MLSHFIYSLTVVARVKKLAFNVRTCVLSASQIIYTDVAHLKTDRQYEEACPLFRCLKVEEESEGAVVRAEDLIPDDVVANVFGDDALRREEVIESPADILGTRVHHVSPERVSFLLK